MKNTIRLLIIFFGVVLIAGCGIPMVELQAVNKNHIIDKPLTKEQVKESIIEGAKYAGWIVKDLGSDTIQATYHIKTHTVHVQIEYTDSNYSLYYKSSYHMKMLCPKSQYGGNTERVRVVVSGGSKSCPDDTPPVAIHTAYKTWIDQLNDDIQTSLAGK